MAKGFSSQQRAGDSINRGETCCRPNCLDSILWVGEEWGDRESSHLKEAVGTCIVKPHPHRFLH